MSKRIIITPKASQDLEDYFDYIAQNNPNAALKFFDASRQTFATLAKMSGMGRLYPVLNSRLVGLRKWSVKGFENYLIFYLFDDENIKIIRILHASRDIDKILNKNNN